MNETEHQLARNMSRDRALIEAASVNSKGPGTIEEILDLSPDDWHLLIVRSRQYNTSSPYICFERDHFALRAAHGMVPISERSQITASTPLITLTNQGE